MAKRLALITGGMGGLGATITSKMLDAGFSVAVDLKTVNNRFLDVHLRLGADMAGVEALLSGKKLNDQTIAEAASHAVDGVDANSDLYASDEYRRHLAQVHTRRAIANATGRAG